MSDLVILRGMSDLVVLVFIHLVLRGMSEVVHLSFILLYWEEWVIYSLYTERNEWSCALVEFFNTYIPERNEWFSCATTCVYSFILRGMSDLVVQHLYSFLSSDLVVQEWVILCKHKCDAILVLIPFSTERNECIYSCILRGTLVFIPLYWEAMSDFL